jgi:DNA-binding transcriptional LysR family regulator
MELRQLEYFVAVTEESSFTKAAARLNVAQPGVSAQLRQLERELGQPLLDRSARAVRLTEVGAAVLPHARAALAAVAAVHNTLDELTGLVRGHVAVGAVSGCGALGLPDLLASFHDAHPGVQISLREGNSDRLVDDVRAGKLDLALVAAAGPPAPALEAQVVIDESLVADEPRQRMRSGIAEAADRLRGGRPPVARRARRAASGSRSCPSRRSRSCPHRCARWRSRTRACGAGSSSCGERRNRSARPRVS